MKIMKIVLTVVSLFLFVNNAYSQLIELPVDNPNLLKLYVINNGMYRLTKSDFVSAGINTATIDPRTIRLINKGIELPVHFEGESDGTFDDTDFMDFFGERNYGGVLTYYNGLFDVKYTKDQYLNYYTDTNIYWVTWGGVHGLRYKTSPLGSSSEYEFSYHYDNVHFEFDNLYSLGENLSNTDYRYFINDLLQGEGWFWKKFLFNNTLTHSYTFPDIIQDTAVPVYMNIWAYPGNQTHSITNEHAFAFLVNGTPVDTVYSNNLDIMDDTISFNSSLLLSGGNDFFFRYRPSVNFTSGFMYFDYFEIRYPRNFRFNSNGLSFVTQSQPNDTASKIFRISGYNGTNEINIYDVKNGYRINNISQSGDTLIFVGKGNGKFEVINKEISQKPMRMKQRTLPDLQTSSNGADYLLIYNKKMTLPAEQLRLHRETFDGYRSVKTEVEDIYDVFNYGLEDPAALRSFIQTVYDNWAPPKVQFVCLFGRGSLDPKRNLPTSNYYENLVPVYGNPTTDGYFVNFTEGTLSYVQKISVGRIPVYTPEEAQILVDKIIEHDTREIEEWDKQFGFVTGGFSRAEQDQFASQSNNFINSWIVSNPLKGEAFRIYRIDSAGYQTFNYSDSILNTFKQGAAIVNYVGHAATNFWDNGIEEPSILTNYDTKNVVFSFTCFTGKNSEPELRSFCEKFLLLPDRGAVGFVGSTGWSFVISGNNFNNYIFRAISENNLRALGDIVRKAGDYMKGDTSSFSVRNMINCYNLIGDPGMKLKSPAHPEFVINENSWELSNPYPVLKDTFQVTINPVNLGVFADSCKLKFTLRKNGVPVKTRDSVIYAFGFRASVSTPFVIDTMAHYTMQIQVDPDNWNTSEDPDNNSVEFPIQLMNYSYIPLKPLDNEIVRQDSIEFVGINPILDTNSKSSRVILQLDTTQLFSSPLKQTYFHDGITMVSTKFNVKLPIPDSNIVYYWRLNSIVDGDSSGWSEIRRIRYNPNLIPKLDYKKVSESLTKDRKLSFAHRSQDSIVHIKRSESGNFYQSELYGLSYNDSLNGLILSEFQGNIFARSFGGNYWDASYFIVNDKEFYLIDPRFWGYNFAKVRKADGKIIEVKNFSITGEASNDSIVNYLNTFGPSHILITVKSYPITLDIIGETAKVKLRQMGSTMVDNIINRFDKWCMISIPNDTGGYTVSEQYSSQTTQGWVPAETTSTLTQKSINGYVNGDYGPAERWGYLSWEKSTSNQEKVLFDVIGIEKSGERDTLFTDLVNNTGVDLSGIDARDYPHISLIGKVLGDTSILNTLPVLKSINLTFQPAPEFIINTYKWVGGDTIFQYGDYTTKVNIAFENLGYSNMSGAEFRWSTTIRDEHINLNADTVNFVIGRDSIYKANIKFKLYFEEIGPIIPDYLPITLTVVPLNNQNEFYTYNNILYRNVKIKNEEPPEVLTVKIDGRELHNGDKVNMGSEVYSLLKDIKQIPDTSLIRVFLNGNYQPYYNGSTLSSSVSSLDLTNSANEFSFEMKPDFEPGENTLTFHYRNSLHSQYDTLAFTVIADNEFRVENLFNYPNPMRTETKFMFDLNGASEVSSAVIKIYTVTGRQIKTIEIFNPVNGLNETEWDGRDDDGDLIANGTYLYRLLIYGEKNVELPIQKLVVLK